MANKDDILNNAPMGDGSGKISLDGGRKQPGEDKLMAYLDGQLLPEEQHGVEQWLSDEGMESDAIDGLKLLEAANTRQTVNRLNNDLHKTLHSRKGRRREAKADMNSLIAVVVIVLLIAVAYLVIKMIK